jgi:hypothetical protein
VTTQQVFARTAMQRLEQVEGRPAHEIRSELADRATARPGA